MKGSVFVLLLALVLMCSAQTLYVSTTGSGDCSNAVNTCNVAQLITKINAAMGPSLSIYFLGGGEFNFGGADFSVRAFFFGSYKTI